VSMQRVIVIDRKKYAAGLFWQPVAVGVVARNYARVLSRGVDKRLNLFAEYRSMVGLGARRFGHSIGMPSAAAEIMESFAEYSSFLAVFRVQNMYWLIAARNGVLIQDNIFDQEIDARAEFDKLSGIPEWGALFAPSAWEIPRAVDKQLHEIFLNNVRAILKPVSRVRARFLSLFLLAVFILGLGYLFKDPVVQMMSPRQQIAKINPELAEEYKKRIEENNKELDKKFNVPKEEIVVAHEPLVMPYELLPNPADRAYLCYQAIGFLMQPIIGWIQTSAECGEAYASVTFKRGFGSLADFYELATDAMPGVFVQEKSDSEIYVTAKLPELMPYASQDERDAETVLREVNTLFQRLDNRVDTNIEIDTIGNGAQSVNLQVVEVGASSKLTPPEFIKIFDELGGVYMTRATWDAKSRNWNYEVIIYAK